jgi:hypothetical protein
MQKPLSESDRLMLRAITGNNYRARLKRAAGTDNEFTRPTLAHVPGVEPEGRYSTVPFRYTPRKTVDSQWTTKSRITPERLSEPRIVHLGRGRTVKG